MECVHRSLLAAHARIRGAGVSLSNCRIPKLVFPPPGPSGLASTSAAHVVRESKESLR
jgi:hypothetical protein